MGSPLEVRQNVEQLYIRNLYSVAFTRPAIIPTYLQTDGRSLSPEDLKYLVARPRKSIALPISQQTPYPYEHTNVCGQTRHKDSYIQTKLPTLTDDSYTLRR